MRSRNWNDGMQVGDTGPRLLSVADPPRNMLLHHFYYNAAYGHSRSTVWHVCQKNGPFKSSLLGPLEVSETDTGRLATYDFLLVIHSKRKSISYCYRNKQQFWSKIANFHTPCVFNSPAIRVPIGIL